MLFSVLLLLGICLVPAHAEQAGKYLGSPFLQDCFEEAKKIVDDAYKYSREESLRRVRRDVVRPQDILRLLKQPRGDTRSAVRSADYMGQTLRLVHDRVHHVHKRSLNATDLLTTEDLERLAAITGCAARTRIPSCRTTQNINKYRTITSVCNNLNKPRLGASNTPFRRWLPAEYDDGISQPKGWNNRRINNFLLPLVRQVSNNILSTNDGGVVSDREFTHMVTLFGQWNDHDLTFTPFSPSIRSFSNGVNCDESCERTEPCIPIAIPPNDPRIRPGPESCIPSFRSAPVCGTGFSAYNFGGEPNKREQINALTAFLDLSQVYGSEDKLALFLRDLDRDDGLLRVNAEFKDNGRELLPFHPMQVKMCATRGRVTNNTNAKEVPCFIAGDTRVDENIALTSIHTLFLREHNRLARQLKRINPHWDSETLYQEARKIMGAYTQVFVFRDYLPHIVGDEAMKRQLGRYPGYNPNIDPSISNVFATAAYRFAHLAIQPFLARLDANFRENRQFPNVPLFKAFFTPWRIIFEGGIDPLLRGLIDRPAKLNTQDHMMVDALRERLFQFVMEMALDLGSLNMQRGRDHGLPGYNAWRKFCGLSQPRNQVELGRVLNNSNLARRLLQLYGTPDNIDVWLGGVAEPFVRGGRVGSLFACLIANQFKNIRQGDRLWYENPGVFTPRQRSTLSRASLSKIICDNTAITSVPRDVFNLQTRKNPRIRCASIRSLDLMAWRERPCTGNSGPGDDNCDEVSRSQDAGSFPDPMDHQEPLDNEDAGSFPDPVDYQEPLDNEVADSFPDPVDYQEPPDNEVADSFLDPVDYQEPLDNEAADSSPGPVDYQEPLDNEVVYPAGPPGLRGPPGSPAVSINAIQPQSAFSIRPGEYNPSSEKIICFRQVIHNKQNHYSTQTGVFTCVIPGVYKFSFLCTSFTGAGSVDLWCNKELVLRGFKVYQGGRYLSSGDTALRLERGDQVWLEASDGTSGLSPKSFFSGHLLFPV